MSNSNYQVAKHRTSLCCFG